MQGWNREDGEKRRNHRRGRRRCWSNKGGVRSRQCSAGTEMEKGGEIIEEGEDSAGTMKVYKEKTVQ